MGALNEYSSLFKTHMLLWRWGMEANKATDATEVIESAPPLATENGSEETVDSTPSSIPSVLQQAEE